MSLKNMLFSPVKQKYRGHIKMRLPFRARRFPRPFFFCHKFMLELLDDLGDRRGYSNLKEVALDLSKCMNRFGRGGGPVV
jgi:hypothetical protein